MKIELINYIKEKTGLDYSNELEKIIFFANMRLDVLYKNKLKKSDKEIIADALIILSHLN